MHYSGMHRQPNVVSTGIWLMRSCLFKLQFKLTNKNYYRLAYTGFLQN